MSTPSGKFIKISDTVFQETEPMNDDEPKNWELKYHSIKLNLHNDIDIVHTLNTHQYLFEDESTDTLTKRIESNVKNEVLITTTVDRMNVAGSFHFAEKESYSSDIYQIESPKGNIHLRLKSSRPTKPQEGFNEGIYFGTCYRIDYDEMDDVGLELLMPYDQLKMIIDIKEKHPKSELNVIAYILSYSPASYDSDQIEPPFSQNIIGGSAASAFIKSIKVGDLADYD
jgi:hypothetical protein